MHPLQICPSRYLSVMIPSTKQCGKYLYSTSIATGLCYLEMTSCLQAECTALCKCHATCQEERKNPYCPGLQVLEFSTDSLEDSAQMLWKETEVSCKELATHPEAATLKCAGSLEPREELHCGPDPKALTNRAPFFWNSQFLISSGC